MVVDLGGIGYPAKLTVNLVGGSRCHNLTRSVAGNPKKEKRKILDVATEQREIYLKTV